MFIEHMQFIMPVQLLRYLNNFQQIKMFRGLKIFSWRLCSGKLHYHNDVLLLQIVIGRWILICGAQNNFTSHFKTHIWSSRGEIAVNGVNWASFDWNLWEIFNILDFMLINLHFAVNQILILDILWLLIKKGRLLWATWLLN